MIKEPVDAVITWVDGNNKAHADKLANYFEQMGIDTRTEEAAPTRYNQCGEINYCVKSLLRFAPWIRTIYIVTDAQTPPIMKQFVGSEKVKLIDHRDIFCGYEEFLPTFNSVTIESMIWRIKGLSNHFIYLNDDCSIIRPVSYDDFFRDNKIVLRGSWKVQLERKWRYYLQRFIKRFLKKPDDLVARDLFQTVQENGAKLAGWHKHFLLLPHAPFSLKKKTFEDYFRKYPDILRKNICYAIRNHQQFAPLSLIAHLEIKQNNVVFDNSLSAITVNGGWHSLNKINQRLAHATKKSNVAFVCMQSIDEAPIEIQTQLIEWLDKKIS